MNAVRTSTVGAAALALLVCGCLAATTGAVRRQSAPADIPKTLTVTAPGTLTDAREPQATVDEAGRVYVTFGAGNAVYCATSRDRGKTYAAPVKVAEAGELMLGMRRGPRIAARGKTLAVSAIYGQQGKGRDGDILAWRSTDGGKTWRGPATVNDVPGAAREGLHGMAAAQDGKLACVWLDLRGGKGTRIFAAVSHDDGATWGRNQLVYRSPDGTVCECCHPSVAYDAKGRLFVMWRNALGGARDMYLTTSSDGGKTFAPAQKLGDGTWTLQACPMDGGAIAVSPDGKTVDTFWRRAGEMYACAGAPGEPERPVGRGEQGWTAFGPGGPYRVWLARRPGALRVQTPGARDPITLAHDADDPVVAAAPNGRGPVVVVWKGDPRSGASIQSAVLSR